MLPELPKLYWYLALTRILLVLVPQLGYIHPDEYFQSIEVQAGKAFDVEHNTPWEFNATFPVRSMAIPYFTIGVVYRLGNVLDHFLRPHLTGSIITPYFLVVAPRLLMCALSFLVDASLYKICINNNERYKSKLVILASSYVMIVYATRTFSNTVELILFALLQYYVCESLTFSNTLTKKREYLNYRYETSRSIVQKVKFHKLRLFLASDSLRNCFQVGTIAVFGFFNRPTFLAFALFPVFFWLYRGMGNKFVAPLNYHLRILVLIFSCIPGILINVLIDSFYYGYLTWGELGVLDVSINNFIFTPWNFVKYNIDASNLAKHGLHPRFLHILVNMPLLFNILALFTFQGFCQAAYKNCSDLDVLDLLQSLLRNCGDLDVALPIWVALLPKRTLSSARGLHFLFFIFIFLFGTAATVTFWIFALLDDRSILNCSDLDVLDLLQSLLRNCDDLDVARWTPCTGALPIWVAPLPKRTLSSARGLHFLFFIFIFLFGTAATVTFWIFALLDDRSIFFVKSKHHLLPTVRSLKGLMMLSYMAPLGLLSVFPHQEPRFLIPLIVPLVYLHGSDILPEQDNMLIKLESSVLKKSKTPGKRPSNVYMKLWLAANVILAIFFGFLHQGGVYQVTGHLSKDMRSESRRTEYYIVTSHIYTIPESLFLQTSSDKLHYTKTTKFVVNKRYFLHEEGSSDLEILVRNVQKLSRRIEEYKSANKGKRRYKLFLILPSSLEDQMHYTVMSNQLQFNKVKTFYPHISTEAFPNLAQDLFYLYSNFKLDNFQASLGYGASKIASSFGLSLYEIKQTS